MNKKLVLLGAGLLLTAATASAQKLVTGRVTDSHGEPVMGATVRVPGTKIMTTTDADGKFKLGNVPASAKKLNVSFIGMQPSTVSVAGNVNVVLQDNELGEAVVIGYGTGQKLGTVVGSVKKVGSDKISGKPTANVSDALQGQVAGLQVLNTSGDVGDPNTVSMKIRGMGSLSASSYPLIVIDGSPAGSSMLSMLSDDDIENITVLKDASATSIYGSRAANGVVYVTTKKGRAGEKAQLKISQKVGWSQLSRSINENMMNANELLQFQLENGIITSSQYETYKTHGANTNWQKYFFDNAAPMYSTDFSLSGASENTNYYVSGTYLNQKSITKFSHFKRYTLRTNLETKPRTWLTFGIKQSATYTDRLADGYTNESRGGALTNSSNAAYWFPAYWDPYDPSCKETHQHLFSETIEGGIYDTFYLSSLQPRKLNDIVYNGVAYAVITPVKGLTVKSQLGLYATDSRQSSNTAVEFPTLGGVGTASESHARSSQWTITNTAEYKFGFRSANDWEHKFTLLAGQEGIKYSGNGFGTSGLGISDNRLLNLGAVTKADLPSYSYAKYEYLSFFGRADYNLNDKYFANFTLRNDQSSRFGNENRSAMFMSGGLLWNVTSESFMAPTRGWLTDLQLKFSVGSTGNSEIGNYTYQGLLGNTAYMGQGGWYLSQPANSKLGWEKQIQYNVGFTARLFDRLNLDVNVYTRKTTDMLMGIPLPYTTGFSTQTVNIGGLRNTGIELEANYDVYRSSQGYFNVYANYSYNRNKIDELFNDLNEWTNTAAGMVYTVGKSITYYFPIFAGVDKEDGQPMWYKKGYKGKPGHEFNSETMTKIYSDDIYQNTDLLMQAPHYGGFGFSANWKGFTLAADFSYVIGKYMINNDWFFQNSSGNAMNGLNQSKDMLNAWKKPGDITLVPSLDANAQFDDRVIQNASFMRLKNLSLSYDLPADWMRATRFFENVRLNFTARNLFTVTKYEGVDPEVDANLANGNYPATRQYTFGIDVTF